MRHLALIALTTTAACSAPGPGGFTPPFEQTSMTLATVNPDGRVGVMDAQVTGTREVGSKEVPVLTLTYPVGDSTAQVEIVGETSPGQLVLGGFSVPATSIGIGVDLVLAEPLEIDLTGDPGDVQELTVDGSLTIGDPTEVPDTYLPLEVTATVVAQDAIAPSAMGDIAGCHQVALDIQAGGISGTGEVWVRDDNGLVHGVFDVVPFGRFETGPTTWTGFDDAGGRRVIQREGLLDADHPTFSLSTYDLNQTFDADKNTHAQMWLELRWADADRARTTEAPPVSQEFGTIFGFFPSQLVQSNVSVLHPDDADEGFVYWVALVDEAAKNEPDNPIAYSASATHLGGDAVLAGAFIRYARSE